MAPCSRSIIGIAATVGGQDKKDPAKDPQKDPPKVDPKPTDPKPADPKPADPNAKSFQLKLEKGKSFYQEMGTSVTQIIKVQGQDLTQKQESTFYFKWTPTKQEGDKWFVEQEVEGLKMTIDISGNLITYDSTKQDGGVTAGNPTLTEFFKNARRARSSPRPSTRPRRSRRWRERTSSSPTSVRAARRWTRCSRRS